MAMPPQQCYDSVIAKARRARRKAIVSDWRSSLRAVLDARKQFVTERERLALDASAKRSSNPGLPDCRTRRARSMPSMVSSWNSIENLKTIVRRGARK
jgi:hypothetical protein